MTDMLQAMMPYKTAIELCALEQGSLSECNIGASGIPQSKSTTYVSSLNVSQGIITAVGQQALKGLTASLTPQFDSTSGDLSWQKTVRRRVKTAHLSPPASRFCASHPQEALSEPATY